MVTRTSAVRTCDSKTRISRRRLFERLLGIVVLGTAIPLLTGEAAKAHPKVSKEQAKYQTEPKDGKTVRCASSSTRRTRVSR